jgi:hypothetical protein
LRKEEASSETSCFCVFIFGVTMEKILEEVYGYSDIQPLSKAVMLHFHLSLQFMLQAIKV